MLLQALHVFISLGAQHGFGFVAAQVNLAAAYKPCILIGQNLAAFAAHFIQRQVYNIAAACYMAVFKFAGRTHIYQSISFAFAQFFKFLRVNAAQPAFNFIQQHVGSRGNVVNRAVKRRRIANVKLAQIFKRCAHADSGNKRVDALINALSNCLHTDNLMRFLSAKSFSTMRPAPGI